MNEMVINTIITVITSSSVIGFIQYLISRHDDKKDKQRAQIEQLQESIDKLQDAIMGQGHDRLVHTCKGFLDDGEISIEDYNDLKTYLYDPYIALGGNGTGEEYFNLVKDLPRKKDTK